MFITIDVLGTILCITCILIAIYGVKKRIRSLFLFGICFFNLTPIIREAVLSAENNSLEHLEISLFFLIQVIIALPIRTEYNRENTAAMALSKKIGLSILVANLSQGGLILADVIDAPLLFGCLHLSIVIVLLYVYIVFYKKENAQWH